MVGTSTSVQSLSERLNATDAPDDAHLEELQTSIRQLADYLAHAPRPETHPTPSAGSAAILPTNHIHLAHSSHSKHVSSSWNGDQILNPTDARAGKTRKRGTTVDQAGGWARGSLMMYVTPAFPSPEQGS